MSIKQPDAYRFLAPFYEKLAFLVFGTELKNAHQDVITEAKEELKQARTIVWLGGGTGLCINEVLRQAPQAKLLYIEASKAMISRAQTQIHARYTMRVEWINEKHSWLYEPKQVQRWLKEPIDTILTFFFLDVLPQEECLKLMCWAKQQHIKAWLFADFVPQKIWYKKAFIRFMYLCFMLTTKIQQKKLLDHRTLFLNSAWNEQVKSRKLRAKGLVVSSLFKS